MTSGISSLEGGQKTTLVSRNKEHVEQIVQAALASEPVSNALKAQIRDVVETSLPAVVAPKEPTLSYQEKLGRGMQPTFGQSVAAKAYETMDWTSVAALPTGIVLAFTGGVPLLVAAGIAGYGLVGRVLSRAAIKSGNSGNFWGFFKNW